MKQRRDGHQRILQTIFMVLDIAMAFTKTAMSSPNIAKSLVRYSILTTRY